MAVGPEMEREAVHAVDVHVHVMVEELLGEGLWRAQVRHQGDRTVVEWRGQRITSVVGEFVDPTAMLEQLRAVGVDGAVLSPWVSMLPYHERDLGLAREVCEVWNHGLSKICANHPGRLWAFGAIPLWDPTTAGRMLAELRRYPGLVGVEVTASVQGRLVGDDSFLPFWEAVHALDLAVFVHPDARSLGLAALSDFYLWNTVGNPLETTVAAAHMVMSGVLERFPGLRVVLAHGGGALPVLKGRMRHAQAVRPEARTRLKEDVAKSVRRFLYDTVTHDPARLRYLVEEVGPDRVLLGSDFPFDMGLSQPVEFVKSAKLDAQVEARVLRHNAVQVLGLG